ncbi:MAG: GNAT family N-acetyltransferase [Candidatus Dojkabacteria bacterium]
MKLNIKKFNELTPDLLYKILQLRFDVFVLEQKSLYEEFDNKDLDAYHLFYLQDNEVIAYMRVLKEDSDIGTFGRVVVAKESRGMKLGKEIVKDGIKYLHEDLGVKSIKIEAQEYLKNFYESFGFKQVSAPYDDCGVMHIHMTLEFPQ